MPSSRAEYLSNYRKQNRERLRALNAKWREDHREELRQYAADYRREHAAQARRAVGASRAKYRAKYLAKMRTYRERNREALKAQKRKDYATNRSIHLARAASWREANPEVKRAYNSKRRATKAGARVGNDRKAYVAFARAVRTAERITCYWCGKNVPKAKRHLDHIQPLAAGGADAVHNLCCSCSRCNLSKHDRLPEEFSGQFELSFV